MPSFDANKSRGLRLPNATFRRPIHVRNLSLSSKTSTPRTATRAISRICSEVERLRRVVREYRWIVRSVTGSRRVERLAYTWSRDRGCACGAFVSPTDTRFRRKSVAARKTVERPAVSHPSSCGQTRFDEGRRRITIQQLPPCPWIRRRSSPNMKSSPRLEQAVWGRSTARATRSSSATSPSKFFPTCLHATLSGWLGSSAKRSSSLL